MPSTLHRLCVRRGGSGTGPGPRSRMGGGALSPQAPATPRIFAQAGSASASAMLTRAVCLWVSRGIAIIRTTLIDKRPLRCSVTIAAFYKCTNNFRLIPIKPDNSHKNSLGSLLGYLHTHASTSPYRDIVFMYIYIVKSESGWPE